MKSGVYDGKTDTHKLMDQSFTREDTLHAWYDEPGGLHPFDRTTKPMQKNTVDHGRQIFLGDRGRAMPRTDGSRPDRSRASSSPAASMARRWQHYDPLVLDMYQASSAARACCCAISPACMRA